MLGFLPDAIYCPAHNRLMAHWLQTGSKKEAAAANEDCLRGEGRERKSREKVKMERERGRGGKKQRSNTS